MNLGLIIKDEKVIVNSRDVAEVYVKQHKDVLRVIDSIIAKHEELNGRNFTPVEYEDAKGELRRSYEMDRQGFSILVNKFTGDKALEFTIKYTQAFEDMSNQVSQLPKLSKELQAIFQLDQRTQEFDSRLTKIENNITIDYAQQGTLQKLARAKAVSCIGGIGSPAYKDKSLKAKVFSAIWTDYKDYVGSASYKDTLVKDFQKGKEFIASWQLPGKLLREIELINNQMALV